MLSGGDTGDKLVRLNTCFMRSLFRIILRQTERQEKLYSTKYTNYTKYNIQTHTHTERDYNTLRTILQAAHELDQPGINYN